MSTTEKKYSTSIYQFSRSHVPNLPHICAHRTQHSSDMCHWAAYQPHMRHQPTPPDAWDCSRFLSDPKPSLSPPWQCVGCLPQQHFHGEPHPTKQLKILQWWDLKTISQPQMRKQNNSSVNQHLQRASNFSFTGRTEKLLLQELLLHLLMLVRKTCVTK